MYKKVAEEMLAFVQKNPTAFHVIHNIEKTLSDNGFEKLSESQRWQIKEGGKYFVSRNDSSIISFRVGKDLDNYGFQVAAAHSDSPTFKVKEKAELFHGKKYVRLNTEGYGGMICSSWLDRPLSIAGRVIVKNEEGCLETKLLDFDRDLVLIPNVAIHMNRKINEGFAYNKQIDLMPLFSGKTEDGEVVSLKKLVAEKLQVEQEAVLGSDLYLYSREHASIWGVHDEFVSAGRLDDQECVFAIMKAFVETENEKNINVLAVFDNEEVGSGTKQGADSTFMYDVFRRVNQALGKDEEDFYCALANSFMLSADNAHAVHPNHPEVTDVANCVYMNEGVVVKSHAGQKYTSDAMSIAMVKEMAKKADIPLQYFANRSDRIGGSTLGNIAMSHVSMNAADIGLAQLAMHSAYETAGSKDVLYLVKLLNVFYKG